MRFRSLATRIFCVWTTITAACWLAGCASEPVSRIVFPNATLNGQPARVSLDTGSGESVLTGSTIRQLKIKSSPVKSAMAYTLAGPMELSVSEPIQVTLGSRSFSSTFPVMAGDDGEVLVELIGWPEIRDNILIFDSYTHTLDAASELPKGATDWTKFQVPKNSILWLEYTRPDGTTGKISVDTGFPTGVCLPPAQWKAWQKAHPNAPSYNHFYGIPFLLYTKIERGFWATDVQIGPLTLTDVTVAEAIPRQNLGDEAYEGTLGMDALARMNLVIDAKNGVAYLRPLPATGQPAPAKAPPAENWTVAESLPLNLDIIHKNSELMAADLAQDHGDWQSAQAHYAEAIRLDPNNSDTYGKRAWSKYGHGDYTGAIADYTHTLELDPKNFRAYYNRAVCKQYQGALTGAIADYDEAISLQSKDAPYPAINRYLLQLRVGQTPSDLVSLVAQWEDGWTKTLGQFVAGNLKEADLLAAAAKRDKEEIPDQQCEAFYYAGVIHLLKGDPPGARDLWQKCLATDARKNFEYDFARSELAKLGNFGQK